MFDSENQICVFAEQAAAFIYDELESEKRAAFETHLQFCGVCADELSGFKAVRASIIDWRALDFDSLESPAIEIGSRKPIEKAAPVSQKSQSWLDGLRKIFTPSPVFAFAAVLIFTAICVAFVAYNFSGARQIAVIGEKENPARTSESAIRENVNQAPTFQSDGNKSSEPYVAERLPESKSADDKNIRTENAVVRQMPKASNGARVTSKNEIIAQKNYNAPPNRKIADAGEAVAKNDLTTKKRSAPKLSSIEEDEEDASLRLSDLLDDAGGK